MRCSKAKLLLIRLLAYIFQRSIIIVARIHLLPLEKAWVGTTSRPRAECLHSWNLCLHPRGSNATEGSCAVHRLVGGHSVHPRFLQKLVRFWSGRTEFAPTGLRRKPIVCTNRVPLIHPENAEGFFSTPSPQGKAWVSVLLHKLVNSRQFCIFIKSLMTSPASMKPATGGTKEQDAGDVLPVFPLISAFST